MTTDAHKYYGDWNNDPETPARYHVNYIFRAPEAGFHSIEGVFGSVIKSLPEEFAPANHYLPLTGAGYKSLVKNCLAVRRLTGSINHITGHINYVALALNGNSVLTVHDVRSGFSGSAVRDSLIAWLWYRLPARRVKQITVVSRFSAEELAAVIPFAASKIRVVYDPYDATLQYAGKDFNSAEPRILHIGTKPNKNLFRTARALRNIRCRLVIIGKLTDEQKSALNHLDIDYESFFDLPFNEMRRQYEQCDLVCFASTYEGFGMPVIEANAVGRPVVSGKAGAVPEIAADAACLVDPYDVDSIRDGILKVVNNSGYREQLVSNGLRNVKRFNPEKVARDYTKVYYDVMNA